jgi:hypothetical protein
MLGARGMSSCENGLAEGAEVARDVITQRSPRRRERRGFGEYGKRFCTEQRKNGGRTEARRPRMVPARAGRARSARWDESHSRKQTRQGWVPRLFSRVTLAPCVGRRPTPHSRIACESAVKNTRRSPRLGDLCVIVVHSATEKNSAFNPSYSRASEAQDRVHRASVPL